MNKNQTPDSRNRASRFLSVAMAACLVLTGNPAWTAKSETFQAWADAKKSGKALPFPDFSYVGYGNGETSPPVPAGPIFDVTQYGAVPDDHKSDKAAIRAAIAAADAAGGGVVFFPKGRYIGHGPGDDEEAIFIRSSGIILRGAGAGVGGTEVQYLAYFNIPEPKPMWTTRHLFSFGPDTNPKTRDAGVTTLAADTAMGQVFAEVADSRELKAGDLVSLDIASTGAVPDFMETCEVDPKWTEISKGGIRLKERHRISKIEGNRLTFTEPVNVPMKVSYGVKLSRFTAIERVGIEDMAIRGNWQTSFIHHRSWEDDSAYALVGFGRCADSFIRRVRLIDANDPLNIGQCLHVSALMLRLEGNGGHSAHGMNGSSTACFSGWVDHPAPHWHGPGPSGGANGNVYHENHFHENTSVELHASQPWGTLYDGCGGGLIYARDGGSPGNLPNHLGYLMFWNFEQIGRPTDNYTFWLDKQWGKVVKPWIIGWHGAATTFDESSLTRLESLGTAVDPKSAWLAQLELRLGKRPTWIEAAEAEWKALRAAWKDIVPLPLLEGVAPAPAPVAPAENRHDSAAKKWPGPWVFNGTPGAGKELEDFPPVGDSFSIAFRVKMEPQPDKYQNMLSREEGGKRDVSIFAKGHLRWAVSYEGESKAASEECKVFLNDNRWHRVVFTFDGRAGEARFQVDGKTAATWKPRGASPTPVSAPLKIGAGLFGSMEMVAFWDKALTVKEGEKESAP